MLREQRMLEAGGCADNSREPASSAHWVARVLHYVVLEYFTYYLLFDFLGGVIGFGGRKPLFLA